MSTGVVIACTDQGLAARLRAFVGELGDAEVLAVAENTDELVADVLEREPSIVIVHDELGPAPVHGVVRDLALRRPGSVVVMVTDGSTSAITAAMNAGARSVLELPLSFDEVQASLMSAIDWSRQMEQMLAGAAVRGGSSRARVLTVTGGKGGVGTTTVATHLAWVLAQQEGLSTLLIDLDLEKGDVTSFIEVKYRISIADLAKVAGDLSVRTVLDGVLEHESGLHLLLPPDDVRDVEWVTPQAFREILSLLRGEFDRIVIDAGAHVTPVQAAAVEAADDVLTVVTSDLIAIRGARRSVIAWEALGARKPAEVHVIVNRQHRNRELQPRSVAQLLSSPMLATALPELTGSHEAASNSRTPSAITHSGWWRDIENLCVEAGMAPVASEVTELEVPEVEVQDHLTHTAVGQAPVPAGSVPAPVARPGRRRRGDTGSASIELLGILPVLLLVAVLALQLVLAGMTWLWTGQAAADAAREVSLGATEAQVRRAATDRLPRGMEPGARVAVRPGGVVEVSARVPMLAPGIADLPWRISIERSVVREP